MTRRKWITWASVGTALAALAAITGPRLVNLRDGPWHTEPKPEWEWPR